MPDKSEIISSPFHANYIQLIKETDILKGLEKNTTQIFKLLKKIPHKKIDYAYAEGKWTIREVVQHLIDAERVFGYRALSFSRKDSSPLPGFDENTWAVHAGAASRKWDELVKEYKSVRKSTEWLFHSFSEDQLRFAGEANGQPLNALAIGFIIPGHVAHHIKIIKERYLNF
ncbi:DinB family protein [Flavitalea flava]